MAYSIETLASTRRKTKENVRVEALIPADLRVKASRLIELLKDYYTQLNATGEASYEINSINNARDIDTADSKYLDLIQKEIAASVPKNIQVDKVKLYKSLIRYYSVRGSTDSIQLFFKILFNDNVEVYYPKTDMLIPSSGNWDKAGRRPIYNEFGVLTGYADGIYVDNKGFLSDSIKLQDSYFYQQFSYVIRTGNNVDTWKNEFNRLVHPAGFIFFGEILVLLEAINNFTVQSEEGKDAERIWSSMHKLQPGLVADEDLPVDVYVGMPDTQALIAFPNKNSAEVYLRTLFTSAGKNTGYKLPPVTVLYVGTEFTVLLDQVPVEATNSNHLNMLKDRYNKISHFFDPGTSMYSYADYTIDNVINNEVPWNNIGSTIDISTTP